MINDNELNNLMTMLRVKCEAGADNVILSVCDANGMVEIIAYGELAGLAFTCKTIDMFMNETLAGRIPLARRLSTVTKG